jgi:uncharacterized protein YcnI
MGQKQWAYAIATLVLAVCLPFGLSAQPTTAPDTVAKGWLVLVDKGNYDSSWEQAGSVFKSRITAQAWGSAAASARAPLGAIVTRTTQKVTTSSTLAGLPDGQYAVVQFTSAFKNKASATETVSLQMESGHWAVIGYFIR